MLASQNFNNLFSSQNFHALKPQMQQNAIQQALPPQQQNIKKNYKKQTGPAAPPSNPNAMGNNSQTSIREGDWICSMCNNLNFSFRKECNRCQAAKTDNTSTCVSKNSNLIFLNPVSGLPTGNPVQQNTNTSVGLNNLPQPISMNFLFNSDFTGAPNNISSCASNSNNGKLNSSLLNCGPKPPGLRNPLQDISSTANSGLSQTANQNQMGGNVLKQKNVKLAQSFGLGAGFLQEELYSECSSIPDRPRRLSQEETALPSPAEYFSPLECFTDNRGWNYSVLVTPSRERNGAEEDSEENEEEDYYCGSQAASTHIHNFSPSSLPSLNALLKSIVA